MQTTFTKDDIRTVLGMQTIVGGILDYSTATAVADGSGLSREKVIKVLTFIREYPEFVEHIRTQKEETQ